MRSFNWQACLAGVLVGALATSSVAATQTTELDRTAQNNLGLATVTLATRDVPQSIDVAIAVLDPAPLAKLADELIASHAAVNASTAESQRAEALLKADGNISRKSADAARVQAVADQAHWRQLRSQLRLEWGDALASMDDASLQQVVKSVVGGRLALIRAQPLTMRETSWKPTTARLRLLDGTSLHASVLGPLPSSVSSLGRDWLLETSSDALVPGMALTGVLEDENHRHTGVVVPRAAIIRWNGLTWVFVMVDATHFERRAISMSQALDTGWLVGAPFKAGERVVTTGANALMAMDAVGNEAPAKKASPTDQDGD